MTLFKNIFLLYLALNGSYSIASNDPTSSILRVSESRYWHLLLHYHERMFGGLKGESDDKSFFLSADGRHDPLKEIEAELKAFEHPDLLIGARQLSAQCTYPERYRFLKSELQLTIPDQECERFKRWKKSLDPHAVTLIFASAYLNNPTSMFGHTFIRIDSGRSAESGEGKNLWGNGINFGAPTGNTMIATVFYGLFGGFDGYFTMLPYFEMVNEYNDSEARDLWEYSLNLSDEQIDHLSNHLWELLGTNFPYYFFSKNCTTQILALLDVANPDWHLMEHFYYQVIPADGVRLIAGVPGAVKEAVFRPSLDRKLRAKAKLFSADETQDFNLASNNELKIKGDESPLVLDALIDLQDYRMMKAKKLLTDDEKEKRREILIARAESKIAPVTPTVIVPSRPEEGSESFKISLYGGTQSSFRNFGIQIRPALHDLMDWDAGYIGYSKVIFGEIDLRYSNFDRAIHLHGFDIVDVTSLNPVNPLNHGLSWSAGIGELSPEDLLCGECVAGRGFLGGGYSIFLGSELKSPIVYSLLKANVQVGRVFDHSLRLGPSLEGGVIEALPIHMKVGASAEFFYFPTQASSHQAVGKAGLQLSWQPHFISKNIELRWSSNGYWRSNLSFTDHQGSFSFYF